MENTCETCAYFIQHYRKEGEDFFVLGVGHCVHGLRTKQTRPRKVACEHWSLERQKAKLR